MTATQLTFPDPSKDPTYREAADEWMREHPVAMDLFRRFAQQLVTRGNRFGFRLIAERVRWEYAIDAGLEGEEFKLNDHFTPYIARRIAHEVEGVAPLIECRVTKAAGKPYRQPRRGPQVDPLSEPEAQC